MKYSICQQIEITLVEGKNANILYSNESKKKLQKKNEIFLSLKSKTRFPTKMGIFHVPKDFKIEKLLKLCLLEKNFRVSPPPPPA